MLLTRVRLLLVVLLVFLLAFLQSALALQLYLLLRLPFVWRSSSADSIISLHRDLFDLSFHSYPASPVPSDSESAGLSQFELLVPARLHHIHLGTAELRPEWQAARAECLKQHPDWEPFLWDDVAARRLVREEFPELADLWENYPYLVQRVDALRYMVLYKYGGAILDFDLVCRRPLDPLRRFEFVAPAAHPAGFSIGMMLAAPNHSFVGDLIHQLPAFNRRWLLLPYATVMFSAGCHYASTIYTTQRNRTGLRILSGPPTDPTMHMLNGLVDTPLFRHLGTSSWHAQDVAMFKLTLRGSWTCLVAFGIGFGAVVLVSLGAFGVMRRSLKRARATITKTV
ncbi:hypothetical protein P170DRAFT_112203 [Aspergillus steynii IBT 23096]|uniref:Glycosyl transferase n=1 Tax=Aspergillus steynii IBT 23096 TaxID=1392250 RepID=A0A2I2GIT0_9EURO|nr:uncharacterized protein P170DRAFT_112203 [Aspergillus steynii IBT 23096]PLB52779.1 hypothetical protein P170DRAFT_112203 [Aspergillus steynii IBT 23096]